MMIFEQGDQITFHKWCPPWRWGFIRERIAWCWKHKRIRPLPPETATIKHVTSTTSELPATVEPLIDRHGDVIVYTLTDCVRTRQHDPPRRHPPRP